MAAALLALTMPALAYAQCTPPSDGLVGHWKLDESGNVSTATDSAGSNNGTLSNFPADPTPNWQSGQIANALDFDGVNDVLDMAADSSLNTTSGSVSLWFKTIRDHTDQQMLFYACNTCDDGYGVENELHVNLNSSEELAFFIRGPTDVNIVSSGTAYNDGEWHHVTATWDINDDAILYINGIAEASATHDAGTFAFDSQIRVGRPQSGGADREFGGTIDDVRIYDRALSADEVAALYAIRATDDAVAGQLAFDTKHARMMYCNGTDWVHAGVGSYNPNAVTFDGTNDWLNTGAALNGVTDSKLLSGSIWFRTDALGTNRRILMSNNGNPINMQIGSSEAFRIIGYNAASTEILNIRQIGAADGDWHHVLFSVDLSDTNKRHLYYDDVDSVTVDTYIDDVLDLTHTDWNVGQQQGGTNRYNGDLADLWIDFGTYIDFSIEANRRKFISAEGMPKYLGKDGSLPTGNRPDIFLSGDTITFHSNHGTGGGFTKNGELTPASSQPGACTPDSGPFSLLASQGTLNYANHVWSDGNYVFVSDNNGGLLAYTFDGVNFTSAGGTGGTKVLQTWGDGNYIYTIGHQGPNEIRAWSYDGTTFTQLDTLGTGADGTYSIWGDGNYLYLGSNGNLHALTFDGVSFSSVGSTTLNVANVGMAWGDGEYIYVPNNTGGFRVLSFDGVNFTSVSTFLDTGTADGIIGDGTYLYTNTGNAELKAWSFNGTTATLLDTASPASTTRGVWTDGTYIYSTYSTDDLYAHSFDGSTFGLVDSDTVGPQSVTNVWGDGNYIYVADGAFGIKAYGGVGGCGCGVSPRGGLVEKGQMQYNADFNVMEYCNGVEWVPMGPVGGTPVTNGLVSYWNFDEVAGTTATDSAGSNNGTWNGEVVLRSTSGVVSGGFDFDGTTDFVNVPYDASLTPSEFSVSLWMKPAAVTPAEVQGVYKGAGGNGFDHSHRIVADYTAGNRRLTFRCDDNVTGALNLNVDGYINANQWTHVVMTYSGGTNLVPYIDGQKINVTDGAGACGYDGTPSSFPAKIADGDGTEEFNGDIDEVRFYNRALSAQEVQQLYNFGLTGGLGDVDNACASPARPEGVMLYNSDENVLQYCNGENWIGVGK